MKSDSISGRLGRKGTRKNTLPNPSTICRELKRNTYAQCHMYTYYWALQIVKYRKRRANRHKYRKLTDELTPIIQELLRHYLSPEQVRGYLKQHHAIRLSHETIDRFIYSDATRHAQLKPFLLQGGKTRRKRYGSGARASMIPNRVCITERPKEVEKKVRLSYWECDTVIGLDKNGVLVAVVDRASLSTCCSRGLSRSAQVVSQAIIRMLRPFKTRVQTLIFDNGSEFVKHETMARALTACTYFAHPYSSWERGINENTNGFLRQFSQKRTDCRKVSWQQVRAAVDALNNRPTGKHEGIAPRTNSFTTTSSRWWSHQLHLLLEFKRPDIGAPISRLCQVGTRLRSFLFFLFSHAVLLLLRQAICFAPGSSLESVSSPSV